MGSFVPRTTLSQFRKRRSISIDGRIPGVLYIHQRRSQRPATSPIDQPASADAPQTYMTFRPDEYEPHPGEAVFAASHYTPYEVEMPDPASEEPRWLHDHMNQSAPDAMPAGSDVVFEGPPPIQPWISPLNQAGPIDAIWNRVLNQPRYDAAQMTDELLDQAMHEASGPAEFRDLASAEDLIVDGSAVSLDALVDSLDGLPGQGDLPAYDDHGALAADAPWGHGPLGGGFTRLRLRARRHTCT